MNYFLIWYHFTFGITTGYGLASSRTNAPQIDTNNLKASLNSNFKFKQTVFIIDSVKPGKKEYHMNVAAFGYYKLEYAKEDTTIILYRKRAAL